jgi:hypothetical protein
MALVIDPGFDYHWYRHQRGGFYGQKLGYTAGRNVDTGNAIILDPEMGDSGDKADRGGYFYAGLSVLINRGSQLSQSPLLIELDVFSGRPNPRWALDERVRQELVRLQQRLAASRTTPPDPPSLGYRGFSFPDAGALVAVYRGFITRPRVVLADPTFTVERFLVSTLPKEYTSLGARIVAELERGEGR